MLVTKKKKCISGQETKTGTKRKAGQRNDFIKTDNKVES